MMTLRIARLRRVWGLSSALASTLAAMAYGEGAE